MPFCSKKDCCAFFLFITKKGAYFSFRMNPKEMLKKEDCIRLLREKAEHLLTLGENRYPRRSDFSEREVVAIKAFLGPWPRALEAAEIKPPKDGGNSTRNREQRQRARQQRIRALRKLEKKRRQQEEES